MTAATLTEADASAIGQALAIRREVTEAAWPQGREAQWAIGWALGELDDILAVRDRLLNDPDADPFAVGAPDMGWWDDPAARALEYVDDQALQAAEALRNRVAQARADEESRKQKAAVLEALGGAA